MKKISFRLVSLVLALALCLMPTVAGAIDMKTREIYFTVGKNGEEKIEIDYDAVKEEISLIELTNAGELKKEYSLIAKEERGYYNVFSVSGTPDKAGEFMLQIKVPYIANIDTPNHYSATAYYLLKIIIKSAVTPAAPAPVERPEIVDYSRCEQALIRGVKEWCNIRQRADINSDVIGRAMLGQRISLICWNEDETWCYVDCGGEQGWIAKQFILPIK